MAWICDKNGQNKCEVKELSYNGTFMEVSSITVTVESAAPIAFAIGDYIDWEYDGLRYTLDTAAGVEKQARRNSIGNAFVYENLVFLSPLNAADHVDFLDVVLGNTDDFMTNTEFSFYGTAWDYAKRLEANLCRMYGSNSWKVRIWTGGTCYDSSPATGIDTGSWENKLVEVSGVKCLGGFQQIYDLWGCAYVFSVVSGVNYVDFYDDFEQYAKAWKVGNDDKIFAYGMGNGLFKIRHTPDPDHVLVTRLRAFGSGENLPANYYINSPDYHVDGNESSELAISHLMLPASEWTKDNVKHPSNAYLEANTNLYGVREGVVVWDGSDSELGEIKPTIYGLTIEDLLDIMASGATYRPVEAKWPDTSQRIDKIITGAAPTDNGVASEAGYDFTVVESSGALSAHSFGEGGAYIDVEFNDLVMGTTPSISHLAEYRIVPTSENKIAVSFDIQDEIESLISTVTAYITPYVNGVKIEDSTFPCAVSSEDIDNTVSGITYKKRYKISLVDSTENPIVFSSMLTGSVTFRIRAHIEFVSGNNTTGFPVIRNEYAVSFNLLRGNKAIDKFFSVTIPQIGFDLAAAVANGAKLCMRSGANQPREFQIVPSSVRYIESSDTWYLRCKRSIDQSISTYFPNSNAVIATGDEYYLAGIAMPSMYVEIAAQKLLEAATAWLNLHSKPRMLSSVDVDNKIMAIEGIVLKEGMSLPISDTDLDISPETQESRIIENIRIEESSLPAVYGGDRFMVLDGGNVVQFFASDGAFLISHPTRIRNFSVTLRSKKEKSSLDAAISGATKNLATNASVSEAISSAENLNHGSLLGRDMPNQHPISAITGLEEALATFSFFELDGEGGVKLKDEYNGLWAAGFMAGGGIGESSGGGGIDLDRVWESLTNNTDKPDVKINAAHIPIASANSVGGIKVGSGLSIAADGTLSATGGATGTVTGVKVGTNGSTISPDSNGVVTIPYYNLTAQGQLTIGNITVTPLYGVPIAQNNVIGGFKTGFSATGGNKDYALKLNSSYQGYVSVPWTDTTYKLQVNGSWNGDSSGGTSLGTIYAPTTAGTQGYVLAADSNGKPAWTNLSGVYLPLSGGTLTGDLRLKPTSTNYGLTLNFGNSSYAYISNDSNRHLSIYAQYGISISTGSNSYPVTVGSAVTFNGNVTLNSEKTLTLGSSVLKWDAINSAWHLEGNFYADGFITAGGIGSTNTLLVTLEGTQTISGAKTFSADTTFSRIGVGTAPNSSYAIYASGSQYLSGGLTVGGSATITTGLGVGTAWTGGSNKLVVSGSAIATAWNTSSDRRLKENILSIDRSDAIEKLMQLKPVTWTWNKLCCHEGDTCAGFVAQDVQDVIPQMVRNGGKFLSLDYSMLHAFEIAGMQNHEARIRELEKENAELKRRLCYES